jgi:hypothetical protein
MLQLWFGRTEKEEETLPMGRLANYAHIKGLLSLLEYIYDAKGEFNIA